MPENPLYNTIDSLKQKIDTAFYIAQTNNNPNDSIEAELRLQLASYASSVPFLLKADSVVPKTANHRFVDVNVRRDPTGVLFQKPLETFGYAKRYTVKKGDTLWGICSKAGKGVTVAMLKKWNRLPSDVIEVGQVLIIEGSTSEMGMRSFPPIPKNNIPKGARFIIDIVVHYAQAKGDFGKFLYNSMHLDKIMGGGIGGKQTPAPASKNKYSLSTQNYGSLVNEMENYIEVNSHGGTYGYNPSNPHPSVNEVKNGAMIDCAGLVRASQINIGDKDPFIKKGIKKDDNGVKVLITGTIEVSINDMQNGYYVTFKTNRSKHQGPDGKYDHIGVATNIKRVNGVVVSFDVLHSFCPSPSGPQIYVNYPININDQPSWMKLKGVYKW